MSDGFLGRWSKRKLDVKQGKAIETEPLAQRSPPIAEVSPSTEKVSPPLAVRDEDDFQGGSRELAAPFSKRESPLGGEGKLPLGDEGKLLPLPLGEGRGEGTPTEPPPLTLEDVKVLTADSDFSPFAARNVTPEVKNAAMKKLFTDPRYNVMDGMDIYTGDYSKPDPIPESMLRQLVSAKFLGLFDREEKEEAEAASAAAEADAAKSISAANTVEAVDAAGAANTAEAAGASRVAGAEQAAETAEPAQAAAHPRDVANNPTGQTVAQCEPFPPVVPEPPHHADADLRLQQNHASPGEDPGRGPA